MDKKEKKGTDRKMVLWLLLFLAVGTMFFIFAWQEKEAGLARERDAQEGFLPGMTRDEIQKMMDEKVEEGSIQININSDLTFADGGSEGLVRIVNTKNNHYLLVVEFIRKDNGESVYRSGAMEPGHYLEKDRLDVDLPKGDYPIEIHFKNYNIKSEEYVGEAVAESILHISK